MSKHSTEDQLKAVIAECKAGKRKAQHQFFKLFYGTAMAICMRYAKDRDEAEDMLNEGFLKVFTQLEKYEESGSFDAWFKKVIINTAIDYQRKYKTLTPTTPFDDLPESSITSTTENEALSKISTDELLALIQQLPPTSRSVFNLYVFEEYPHAEIAQMLDMKEGTSHWHLNFARNKLKQLITERNH